MTDFLKRSRDEHYIVHDVNVNAGVAYRPVKPSASGFRPYRVIVSARLVVLLLFPGIFFIRAF